MYRVISLFFALIITSSIYAGEAADIAKKVKNSAMQNAFSYGDNTIESWAKENLSSLRLIEIETRAREDAKPTFRVISLF